MTSLAANYTRIVNNHLQLRYEYRHDFAAGGKSFADRPRGTFTGQRARSWSQPSSFSEALRDSFRGIYQLSISRDISQSLASAAMLRQDSEIEGVWWRSKR